MKIHAVRQQGYQLLHDGAIELSRLEANGIRVDVERLAKTQLKLKNRIRTLRQQIEEDDVWKIWKKRFGLNANLTSRTQLATVLHDEMGYEVINQTVSGKPATDEEALSKIDHPFVRALVRISKYEKASGTFLRGIEREVIGDRLHPFFNLHTARTYRSSSDSPNFQNFPVRDPEIARIIRSQFIASKGCVLVENDFKGIEVSVSACYHKDKNFISYITTPGKDMHRDMAAQLYKLKPSEVSKEARYGAKNKFVFPQFYGDFYVSCAKALWEWIYKGKLKGPDNVPLLEHLKTKGIKKLGECDPEQEPVKGTFEHHVKSVEDDFWNRRFQGYGQWRKQWYCQYLDKGYFDLLTGFRISGSFPRNATVNYPVQGSAFHCLLWALIRVNRMLRSRGMKSMVVGQIHDSLLGDVLIEELGEYLKIVEHVTTVLLRKAFPWLIVPLEIEYEISPPGMSWFDKKEIKFKKGRFQHPVDPKKFTTNPIAFAKILQRTYAKADGDLQTL